MAVWKIELVGRGDYWAEKAGSTEALSVKFRGGDGERRATFSERSGQETRQGPACLSKNCSWRQWSPLDDLSRGSVMIRFVFSVRLCALETLQL